MVFKPGDLVTIGDRPEVYTLEDDLNGGVSIANPADYHSAYASFNRCGIHWTKQLPDLKHYDASGAMPSTPLDFAEQQMSAGTKPTNPKDLIGSSKLPIHLFPTTAIIHGALALLDGAAKYGRTNYRAIGVRASIYHDAALRHIQAWFEGEEVAPDSKVSHLGHALACIAILIDATEAGKLNDDRVVAGGYSAMVERLTPLVAEIKARHADKNPYHYTIKDKPDAESNDGSVSS